MRGIAWEERSALVMSEKRAGGSGFDAAEELPGKVDTRTATLGFAILYVDIFLYREPIKRLVRQVDRGFRHVYIDVWYSLPSHE